MSDWQEELDTAIENDDRHGIMAVLMRLPNIPGAVGALTEDCSRLIREACKKGYPEVLQTLMEYGIIIGDAGTQENPIQLACEFNRVEVLDLLLERNVPVLPGNVKPWEEESPLYIATKLGHMDIIHRLIEKDPTLIKDDLVRSSLLYAACQGGHISMIKLWLTPGVDINHPLEVVKNLADCEKLTPLYGACSGGHLAVVNFLRSNCEDLQFPATVCNAFPDVVGEALKEFFVSDKGDDDQEEELFELCMGELRNKNLHVLHERWLTPYMITLSELRISNNSLTELPDCLPWQFQNLRVFDASRNKLRHFTYNLRDSDDEDGNEMELACQSLIEVNLSYNNLESVCRELFEIESLRQLFLSHNKLKYLSKSLRHQSDILLDSESTLKKHSLVIDNMWRCKNLRKLDVSHNELIMLPSNIQGCRGLVNILASNNRLTTFPQPWDCQLEILDVSFNQLERFPVNVEQFWSGSLKYLNISNNLLDELHEGIVKLSILTDLVANNNKIERLPGPEVWDCGHLHNLDLKHNRLGVPVESPTKKRLPTLPLRRRVTSSTDETRIPYFPQCLAHCLKELRLADNNLDCVPPTVCDLISLEILDLSDNPLIKVLPNELGKLRNCGMLKLKRVMPSNVKSEYLADSKTTENRTREILRDLLDTLRHCKPYHKIKAVVLGKKEKGKTTLVDILAGKKTNVPPERKSIVRSEIKLSKKVFSLKKEHDITLNVWDIAGDEVYTQIHHSVFTPLTLYILVWDFWSITEELDKIEKWINDIQASTSSYEIVLVGTFTDKMKELKSEMVQAAKEMISQHFREHAPRLCPVSCITNDGIDSLKTCLYETATSMLLPGRDRQPVIGRKVPKTYRLMEKLLFEEQQRLESEGKPLFVTQSQFVEIVEQIPAPNDLLSAEETAAVTRFLVEVGDLLHFSDPLGALDTLYFLDPAWLCDILLYILISPEGKQQLKQGRGMISRVAAKRLYQESPRFPSMFVDQYLELLERFEIATSISQSDFLFFPCQLPVDPPIIETAEEKQEGAKCVRRLYLMSECPSGFWMRLVSRMMMRVEQFSRKDWQFRPMVTHSVRALAIRHGSGVIQEPHRKGSLHGLQIKTAKKTFCRELIHVSHADGSFCVEPAIFSGKVSKDGLQNGVLITEVSKTGNFGIMGIIVDEIEDIIQDYYPGLLEPDLLTLTNRLERYALCPTCYSGLPLPNVVNHFTMELCARLLISGEPVICPRGIKQDVNVLVPDMLLKELPDKFFMDVKLLEIEEAKDTCLGVGVTGSVFRAKYDGKPVAVKIYRSDIRNKIPSGRFATTDSTSSDSGTATLSTQGSAVDVDDVYMNVTDTKQLDMHETESIKAMRALKEIRQEVSITSRLHHPCVISLVGLTLRPKLMMALELAPLGSLRDILDKKTSGRPVFNRYKDKDELFPTLFEKELIFKFVYQIAKGLEYLHSNGIIYKDLKSDNILAISEELSAPVNLKLSDYGISKYCWSGRSVGLVGTPGYQAPEILDGKAYDEKVDIFAFAMVIYEILTGRRPYSECDNLAQITKAMKAEGKRPNPKDFNVLTKFPYLEYMMRNCWDSNVFARPSATEMVSRHRMQNLQFLAQMWAVEMPETQKLRANCVLGPAESENKSLLYIWDIWDSVRTFSVLDPEWSTIPIVAQKYEGQQVHCTAKVGQHIWVGNVEDIYRNIEEMHYWIREGDQDNETHNSIEVFTRTHEGTLSQIGHYELQDGAPVQILAVKDRSARMQSSIYSVYVALERGKLLMFKTKEQAAIMRRPRPKQLAGYTNPREIVLRSQNTYCMVHAEPKNEIWIASNEYIDIVSCTDFKVNSDYRINLKILLPICNINPEFVLGQMACVGSQVFCMLRNSPYILEFSANMYRCNGVFNLETSKILGLVVSRELELTEADHTEYSGVTTDDDKYVDNRHSSDVSEDGEEPEPPPVPPRSRSTKKAFKVLGVELNQVQQQLGNVPVVPPRRKYSQSVSVTEGAKTPPVSVRRQTVLEGRKKINKQSSSSLPNFAKSTEFSIELTSVLIVKNSLWIGRSCGDICVIDVNRDKVASGEGYGKVVADMYDLPANAKSRAGKTVEDVKLVRVGKQVAAAYTLHDGNASEVQLAFWDSFGIDDIDRVEKYWNDILYIEKLLFQGHSEGTENIQNIGEF